MADKDGDLTARIVGGVTALAAAYVTRKALTLLWTKTMGKEPPADPESPDISLGEALGWAVVTGVGMEVTRVLAVRAVHRRFLPHRHRDIEQLPL
ncbi:DUF4235 domain-containing protein [Thermobifida halotolerans]|uniref:DUF4235 domain-containing protein n=1 Tax=Thermobifida halotolerans TaxID=483545 RepID=A0A399G6D8_9ACTN|nr:DUF4235 domain-containing protein [Thermobifida halotolerans]UOE21731.1 DUF4235 domain-containing protein [Thermobifida halotolerans]